MNLVDELHAIAAAFTAADVTGAACGAIAVTAHGATRTTKDIDVVSQATLVRMKRLAGRAQALADLAQLEAGSGSRVRGRVRLRVRFRLRLRGRLRVRAPRSCDARLASRGSVASTTGRTNDTNSSATTSA